MPDPMTDERRAEIKAHLIFVAEEGMTIGDVYVRDLLAENEGLREEAEFQGRMRRAELARAERAERTATEAAKRIGELERALADPEELTRRAHEIRNADQQYEFELEVDFLASGGGERG